MLANMVVGRDGDRIVTARPPVRRSASLPKLDATQRMRPNDAAVTKAWLDEAARLANLAADHIERRQYAEAVKLLRATERPL